MDFTSAIDLLEYLRLSNSHWGDGVHSDWIFRGQWDASKKLLASVWRKEGEQQIAPLSGTLEPRDLGSAQKRVEKVLTDHNAGIAPKDIVRRHVLGFTAECRAMDRFQELADERGLRVEPLCLNVIPLPRGPLDARYLIESGVYPNYPVGDVAAFAQHHGVPTRLLDWTREPLFAAYFAARCALRLRSPASARLGIWAVRKNVFPITYKITDTLTMTAEIYTVPRHSHSYLHAQGGLFTQIQRADYYFLLKNEWPKLEVFFHDPTVKDSVRLLTLRQPEAKNLLRCLTKERINASHLMPTLDKVAESLRHEITLS